VSALRLVREYSNGVKMYFSLMTGILALGTEVLVFLSLMEVPPFGKGGCDIVWALPFFGLVVLGLTIPGMMSAISGRSSLIRSGNLVTVGLLINAFALAIPILLLLFGVGRALLAVGGLTNR